MQHKVVTTLMMVAAACGIAFIAGCAKNEAPEITSFTAIPDDSVLAPNAKVVFKAAASDAEGDSLTFEWLASGGTFTETNPDSVIWAAPAAAEMCTVTVRCSDGEKTAEASKEIRVREWLKGSASAYTPDSVYLPNVGTTEIPFTWDVSDTVKPGALVDSVQISLDFDDPDTLELEQFNVTLVSPRGTQVLLYDGVDLVTLDLLQDDVYGFAGEPVAGTWKLIFARNNPLGYNGWVYDCDLDIDFKY